VGIKRGRRESLTTLPLSVNLLYTEREILDEPQPYRPSRPVTEIIILSALFCSKANKIWVAETMYEPKEINF
jgi:hypothetical protein